MCPPPGSRTALQYPPGKPAKRWQISRSRSSALMLDLLRFGGVSAILAWLQPVGYIKGGNLETRTTPVLAAACRRLDDSGELCTVRSRVPASLDPLRPSRGPGGLRGAPVAR